MCLGEVFSNAQPQIHVLPCSPPSVSYSDHPAVVEENMLETGPTWVRILDLQHIIMMLPIQPRQVT